MRLLLDSHAYLWWLNDDKRLGAQARAAIAAPDSMVCVSAATIWEVAIKSRLDRLEVAGDLVAEIAANDFTEVPVSATHTAAAGQLPRHHDDPFDRMLVAQAQLDGLVCVTRDQAFDLYEVRTIW